MAAEKQIFQDLADNGARIIGTVGYDGGSEIPVFNKTYSVDGTGTFGAYAALPGDVAALVRFSTADRSSKNHPIYCFNYWHAVSNLGSGVGGDNLNADQHSAMNTYAADWITGFSDGTHTLKRSRPNGDTCTGSLVEPLLTHRDLPR